MPLVRVKNVTDAFQHLRIKYMLNELNETNYKKQLVATETKRRNKHNIWEVLDMFYNTGCDIMRSLLGGDIVKKDALSQLTQLIEYVNQSMKDIQVRQKCKVPIINPTTFEMETSLSRKFTM